MKTLLQLLEDKSIVEESKQDYAAMINPILGGIAANSPDRKSMTVDLNATYAEKIKKQWDAAVTASTSFKKADRITWFLRLTRMMMLDQWARVIDPQVTNKLRQDYLNRSGLAISDDDFEMGPNSASVLDLQHFLSLPIPAIQSYQFRFQPYREVIADFLAMEEKWKETVRSTIVDDESKVILDCGGKWFWVDTQKAYCDKEAKAMGHCGNEPRQHSSDRLLSLRRRISIGSETRWEPHLTFILTDKGMLTEMKGRGNDKPVEKYFPMIVKLLLDPIVRGIRGGGYKPENNFSLSQLGEDERNQILTKKPELGALSDLLRASQDIDDHLVDRILDTIKEDTYRLRKPKRDGDLFVVGQWAEAERAFGAAHLRDCAKVASIADGNFETELDWLDEDDSSEGIRDLFDFKSNNISLQYLYKNLYGDITDLTESLSTLLKIDESDLTDTLIHLFPNSLKAMWKEVRKEIIAQAKTETAANLIAAAPAPFLRYETIAAGKVRLVGNIRDVGLAIAAYVEGNTENNDYYEIRRMHEEADWMAMANMEMDDDVKTRLDYARTAIALLGDHLRGLIEDTQ